MSKNTIGSCFFSIAIIAFLSAPVSAGLVVTYDFDTDDFGTALVNGQVISTAADRQDALGNPDSVFEFGNYSRISTTQGSGGHIGAAIYDSSDTGPNVTLGDPDFDLLVNRGNILILQDNQRPATSSGPNGLTFDDPDDEASVNSGSIIFDFAAAGVSATPLAIDIIDANGGFGSDIIMTDIQGDTRTFIIPEKFTFDISVSGPNGYETLDLTETALPQPGEGGGIVAPPIDVGSFDANLVATLEVKFTGLTTTSGGIDTLVFMVPEPTSSMLSMLGFIAAMSLRRRRTA